MSMFIKFFSSLKDSRSIVRSLLNHPNHINARESKFTKDDVEALRVKFQPVSEDHVIPNEKVEEFLEKYKCPQINRDMLNKEEFKVREITESKTDDMVADLLRIAQLNNYPLYIEQHPSNKLHILETLRNVDPANDFGEMQIDGEILACRSENTRRAEIPAGYWDELAKGLPIKIQLKSKMTRRK
ncbi:1007_t:CDS:2 [Diversispora eburnea]|uniref:1007_t:CDS:1 n=1 Tax=Diversispora eburnea TaxID=1213867 RepID=A0A9N9ADD9_9GLOM|nr:1007_t:CDS:2 [Diversispora eburnea]